MKSDFATKLHTVVNTHNAELLSQLCRYEELLVKWNKVHNLTGYKRSETIQKYILDSLYPITFLPEIKSAIDIGTGAGFPGLILAMAMPECSWTLVEPLKKRASFLQFVKADIGLSNVEIQSCRIEDLEWQSVDLVTSRAVATTAQLLDYSSAFTHESTIQLFYKGERVQSEIPEGVECKIIQTKERHFLLIDPKKRCRCY